MTAGIGFMAKIENYILATGIVLCGIIQTPAAIESLAVRHIIFGLTTLALCGFFFLRKRKNISITNTSVFLVFAVFCLMSVISLTQAANKSESVYYILVSLTWLMFLVCVTPVIDKKIIVKVFVYMGLLFAICGLFDIICAINSAGILATTGLGFNTGRNLWSSSLLLLIPFSLYSFAKNKNYVALVTIILLAVNIALLQTRSVYLALIIATAITLFSRHKKILAVVAICTVVCFCTFGRMRDTRTLSYRSNIWSRSAKVFGEEPILGVGAGNWKIATPRYGNSVNRGYRNMFTWRAHNDFIEVFVEIGLLGGLCYLGIFVTTLHYTRRMRDRHLAWAMRFGIVAYMVFAFFSFPKERAFHSVILLVMIALVLKDYPIRKQWAGRNILIFSVCSAVIIFAVVINYHRFKTEIYVKKVMVAKTNKDWAEVVRLIDGNYTPFSTMVAYAVTPILHYRAEANLYLDNNEEAYSDYMKAYKLHPNHAAILCNIASYKYFEKKYDESLYYYTKANEVYPGLDAITIPIETLKRRAGQGLN